LLRYCFQWVRSVLTLNSGKTHNPLVGGSNPSGPTIQSIVFERRRKAWDGAGDTFGDPLAGCLTEGQNCHAAQSISQGHGRLGGGSGFRNPVDPIPAKRRPAPRESGAKAGRYFSTWPASPCCSNWMEWALVRLPYSLESVRPTPAPNAPFGICTFSSLPLRRRISDLGRSGPDVNRPHNSW